MAPLIVGNPDCSIAVVCSTFHNTKACKLPARKLRQFSETMVSKEDAGNIARKIAYGTSSYPNVYEDLLAIWRSIRGEDASLEMLIEMLDKFGLCDTADELRENFDLQPSCHFEETQDYKLFNAELTAREDQIKQHIQYYIGELSRYTVITKPLQKKLLANEIITQSDMVGYLHDAPSEKAKVVRLYNLLTDRPEKFNQMIVVLEEENQYKASWVLRRFYRYLPDKPQTNCAPV